MAVVIRTTEVSDDPRLRDLLDASTEQPTHRGELLFHEGRPADSWWVLLEGRIQLVRVLRREQTVVGAFETPGRWAGGFVAWEPSGVYLATGRAAGPGRILRVPASALRELLAPYRDL